MDIFTDVCVKRDCSLVTFGGNSSWNRGERGEEMRIDDFTEDARPCANFHMEPLEHVRKYRLYTCNALVHVRKRRYVISLFENESFHQDRSHKFR